MTPDEALEVLRREHTPYVPQVVAILEVWGEGREPTLDEQMQSDLWCPGCNRAAEHCTVWPLLELVGRSW